MHFIFTFLFYQFNHGHFLRRRKFPVIISLIETIDNKVSEEWPKDFIELYDQSIIARGFPGLKGKERAVAFIVS